jgi:hypothetical protein
MLWKALKDFFNPPPRKTPAEIEAARKKDLVDRCWYPHRVGSTNMVIHPVTRDKLSCMFCPCDLPLPTDARVKHGGSIGGGWDTVEAS